MLKASSKKLQGNAQYEGYSIDLISKISSILGFTYNIRLVSDNRYGSYNKETREWDGMIKELLNHKADLAIADLTITYERAQVVDFTMPFMNLGKEITAFVLMRIYKQILLNLKILDIHYVVCHGRCELRI